MGYTTDFQGQFDLDPALSEEQIAYLLNFSDSRRMKRDVSKLETNFGPCKNIMGTYGKEGEFYVDDIEDNSVIEANYPPKTQPGSWCQWIPTEGGQELIWDGQEKFYDYVEWLEYLIKSFFDPWNIKVSGIVRWQGEEFSDRGKITVKDNKVFTEILE